MTISSDDRRILVTGSAGFLGGYVVRRLVGNGRMIRRHARTAVHDGRDLGGAVEFVTGDLIDLAACKAAVRGCHVVVHVASSLRGSTSSLFLNNVVAMRRLIAAALNEKVEKFVHISSIAVHGIDHLRRDAVVDERCPLDPCPHLRDPYTFSKIVQEQVAWEAHEKHGLPVTVIRPGVIFGPGRDILAARVGLRLGGVMVRMGGRQRLPYIYVENCAAAIAAAALAPNVSGHSFNVVDDELPTGRRLLRAYRRFGGRVRTIGIPYMAIRPLSWMAERYSSWSQGMIPTVITRYKSDAMWKSLHYSNSRAKELLDWVPETGLQEALRRSLQT
jgi:nucleoside-diphosphate-sugar epimerase